MKTIKGKGQLYNYIYSVKSLMLKTQKATVKCA